MSFKIYMIAGEDSGDIYGSKLIESLSRYRDDLVFHGIGGHRMVANGLINSIVPIESISIIGFWEVLKKIFFFRKIQIAVIKEIKLLNPDVIILIDYPGFNIALIKKIKGISSRIVYYVAPQAWAWNKKRVATLRNKIDSLICIFPFEYDWFNQRGVPTLYFGHPLSLKVVNENKNRLKEELGLDPSMKLLSIFPGSRNQEFKSHYSIMKEAAFKIQLMNQNIQIGIGIGSNISSNYKISSSFHIERENSNMLLQASDFAIVASGTITIEAAIYRVPMVVMYKMGYLSWIVSKQLIKTQYVAMVNIIRNKKVVKELIQSNASSINIINEIQKIIIDHNYRYKMLEEFDLVKKSLYGLNPIDDAADFILSKYVK